MKRYYVEDLYEGIKDKNVVDLFNISLGLNEYTEKVITKSIEICVFNQQYNINSKVNDAIVLNNYNKLQVIDISNKKQFEIELDILENIEVTYFDEVDVYKLSFKIGNKVIISLHITV